MNSSKRAFRCICLGIVIIILGFWLLCHADFWTVTYPNGYVSALYTQDFTYLAHLLMCSGAVLSVLSAVVWVWGPASHQASKPIE